MLRSSVFATMGLGISMIAIYDPQGIQAAANVIFFFENDPAQRVYSLAALLVSLGLLLSWIGERSIKHDAMEAANL